MKISTQFGSSINSYSKNKSNSKFENSLQEAKKNLNTSTSSQIEENVDTLISKHIDEKIKKELQQTTNFYEDGIKELKNLWGYGNFDKFS